MLLPLLPRDFKGSVFTARPRPRYVARTWTVDLKQRKIRVNTINPGPIDTPGPRRAVAAETDEHYEQLLTSILNAVPLGRMGNPDEVAKAVAFLASDDSSYITGIELLVDGGVAQSEFFLFINLNRR